MRCVDLEKRFPGYKVGYEDDQFISTQDPWHKVLLCRKGHICPSGGQTLMACTKGRGPVVSELEMHASIVADGDDGVNAEFDVKDAPKIFKIMGAKKR